jgi:RNA polymerase-binding transcription factor DksA
MNTKVLQSYRRRLLDLASRLQDAIVGLTEDTLRTTGGEAAGSLSNAPLHLADLGTDSSEQELAAGLLETQQQALSAINAALERIDAGTYGICEQCGKKIPAGRLKAVPYVTRCVDCARGMETGPATSGKTTA